MYCLAGIFSAFGYTRAESKNIVNLLIHAGRFNNAQLKKDLLAAGFINDEIEQYCFFTDIDKQETITPDFILKDVPLPADKNLTGKTLNWLLITTQLSFLYQTAWMDKFSYKLSALASALNDARIIPVIKQQRAVIILCDEGDTLPLIEQQLLHVRDLIDAGKIDCDYVLVRPRQRFVDIETDGGKDYLDDICYYTDTALENLTEREAINILYKRNRGIHTFSQTVNFLCVSDSNLTDKLCFFANLMQYNRNIVILTRHGNYDQKTNELSSLRETYKNISFEIVTTRDPQQKPTHVITAVAKKIKEEFKAAAAKLNIVISEETHQQTMKAAKPAAIIHRLFALDLPPSNSPKGLHGLLPQNTPKLTI